MRGENFECLVVLDFRGGTSPRARGKRQHELLCFRGQGNIPACAGKTVAHCFCKEVAGEHPRVRGENQRSSCYRGVEEGTSPRARGKLGVGRLARCLFGNIPACAGKTSIIDTTPVLSEEHPRVRGENGIMGAPGGSGNGTSPRARGKQHDERGAVALGRNIPACAGKTAT